MTGRAVLAGVVAAAALGGVACAELPVEDILSVLPGTWEVDPAEIPDGQETTTQCDQYPMQISITETDEGLIYESVVPGIPDSHARSLIRTHPLAIHVLYEDEQRLDPAGNPVEWLLLMPDRDRYYWIRLDWLTSQPGGRTPMFRRCPDGPIA